MDELKTDAKRADGEATFYFMQPRREADAVKGDADLDRDFEKLSEPDIKNVDISDLGATTKEPREQIRGRPQRRRGDLRKQAAEQLEKLQTLEEKQGKTTDGPTPVVDEGVEEQTPQNGQPASGTPADAVGVGQLSMDLDLAPVGTRYHFRKLHGEPRLVLSVRHKDLSRSLSAIIWAGLCLALATAVIQGLRRPDALARTYRCWPWLAAIAGTAWLFLLPAGVLGLILLITALCVLIVRVRKRRTTDSKTPKAE